MKHTRKETDSMIPGENRKQESKLEGYQERKTQWQGITEIRMQGRKQGKDSRQTDRTPNGNERKRVKKTDVQRVRINSEKGKKKRPGINPGLE